MDVDVRLGPNSTLTSVAVNTRSFRRCSEMLVNPSASVVPDRRIGTRGVGASRHRRSMCRRPARGRRRIRTVIVPGREELSDVGEQCDTMAGGPTTTPPTDYRDVIPEVVLGRGTRDAVAWTGDLAPSPLRVGTALAQRHRRDPHGDHRQPGRPRTAGALGRGPLNPVAWIDGRRLASALGDGRWTSSDRRLAWQRLGGIGRPGFVADVLLVVARIALFPVALVVVVTNLS